MFSHEATSLDEHMWRQVLLQKLHGVAFEAMRTILAVHFAAFIDEGMPNRIPEVIGSVRVIDFEEIRHDFPKAINDLVDVTRYLRLHKSVFVENFTGKVGERSLGLMNVGMVENKVICK